MPVPLTLACSHYDRTEGLRDGSVRVEGVDLTYVDLPVEEIFFRMARFQEFDAAELSMSSYVLGMNEGSPFIAIPVFPSRAFRHSSIYVNSSAGISAPKDLVGTTVGIAEYQLTANVWIRGILEEHYGVPTSAVRYRTGGLHAPGRIEKMRVDLPAGVDVSPIGPDQTLAQMLVDGEIDAIYSPRTPRPLLDGDSRVRRLFDDVQSEEQRYHAATGVFPIMHVVVLRRDVYERNRWLARSLFKAFEQARSQVLDNIEETAALRYMLPWLAEEVRRTKEQLGADYWPYGLAGNETTLSTFLRYSHEQGLARRAYEPAELFAPESLEGFVI
jgi:4,5-dihydroxyphthalate decarboxylase